MMSNRHEQQQQLPPSPPVTPPTTKQKPKKRVNSFEKFAATPLPSSPSGSTDDAEDKQEPLFTRVILTPVLVTSFILSLFLINTRNRALRVEANSSPSSLLSYLLPATSEPYQDHNDSKWSHRSSAGYHEPSSTIAPKDGREKGKKKKKSWHLHKKIRKVAKLEVSDALEMRGRVIAVMLVILVLGSVGLWVSIRWAIASLSGWTMARSEL
ncbi:hypothetical protein P153DRAFT_363183 [Dothidotthia symphoricarpi CBS 119687]|uniref:Transmembrane protein n=1 Tax=Dothidotthia symphoricarpi CBS 119687 TaxID=1392245 RepID=A0A6A6ATC0_9PLEO|nr:uncharacterized protein P153DRAFT_363183 [Dothidotthia symphoricarpi CBS 119687]KAF2134205.1 hypothetical protein P153DRAFT_363183 [Dothidotthia symphoricarpi CBS 119687]